MAWRTDALDATLYALMGHCAREPRNRAVVEAVNVHTASVPGPVSAEAVYRIALDAARVAFAREGRPAPSEDEVRARASWGAALASAERPFTIAEDLRGPAKAVHYFASAAISSRVASWLPYLPRPAREQAGCEVAHVLGVLKEVADHFKGSGYQPLDVAIDDAGARGAFER